MHSQLTKLFILLNQLISKPKDDYIKSALRKLVGLGVIVAQIRK